MREPGLEPGTSSLSATRSNQLSYTRKILEKSLLNDPKNGAEILTQGLALSTVILYKPYRFQSVRPVSIGRISAQLDPKQCCFDSPTPVYSLSRLSQRFFLFGNYFGLRRHLGIHLDVVLPLFGYIVFVENGFNRAFRDAGFAVNAFFRMNIKHLFALVKALNGADHDTIGISATYARLGNNVGHG